MCSECYECVLNSDLFTKDKMSLSVTFAVVKRNLQALSVLISSAMLISVEQKRLMLPSITDSTPVIPHTLIRKVVSKHVKAEYLIESATLNWGEFLWEFTRVLKDFMYITIINIGNTSTVAAVPHLPG